MLQYARIFVSSIAVFRFFISFILLQNLPHFKAQVDLTLTVLPLLVKINVTMRTLYRK